MKLLAEPHTNQSALANLMHIMLIHFSKICYFALQLIDQPQLYTSRYVNLQLQLTLIVINACSEAPIAQIPAGTIQAPAWDALGLVVNKQTIQERPACVTCVWNEANAVRVQHGLPLKDLHISLGCRGTELGLHSLTLLLPASPFELDERKLIQVGPSVFTMLPHLWTCMTAPCLLHISHTILHFHPLT